MTAIVLADMKWGIAKNGEQLLYIPEDLRRFREITKDQSVIFGRKTMQNFPDGKPLKGRVNFCLSRNLEYADNLTICKSLDDIPPQVLIEGWCIGGESVYNQLYKWFREVYVTRIYRDCQADQFFPALDELGPWNRGDESQWMPCGDGINHFRYEHWMKKGL